MNLAPTTKKGYAISVATIASIAAIVAGGFQGWVSFLEIQDRQKSNMAEVEYASKTMVKALVTQMEDLNLRLIALETKHESGFLHEMDGDDSNNVEELLEPTKFTLKSENVEERFELHKSEYQQMQLEQQQQQQGE